VKIASKKKIRILHIIARMNVGGPAVIISELLEGLDQEKFELLLAVGFCEQNEMDFLDIIHPKILVVRIEGLGRSLKLFHDIQAFLRLRKLIRTFKPDIVHTHTSKAGLIGRIANLTSFHHNKSVHTYHGHLLTGYYAKPVTRLVSIIERLLAYRTDLLLAVGTQVKNDLLNEKIGTDSKIVVTFPGLRLPQNFDRKKTRRKFLIQESSFVITFVGRLTKIKRPQRIIEIGTLLEKLTKDVKILVVGGGEMFDELNASVQFKKLNIEFLGWRNDVDEIFVASDLAFLTSDNEGIPIVLIQAALAGLPLLSTNVGSVSDILKNGINGFLLSSKSEEFVEKILLLKNDKSLYDNFSKNSLKLSRNYFLAEKMISQHSEIYLGLIH
jgi:glycosyltransferase involved in cell wall biosynthesis